MANMFSGHSTKKALSTLKECFETDPVSNNLWVWCERLEKWGLRICIVLAILGFITIISDALEASRLIDELNIDVDNIRKASAEYGIEIKTVFEVVVEDIFLWGLYCFIEYCAYHALALFIGSLATLVQNSNINTNINLYNSIHNSTEEKDEDLNQNRTENIEKTENTTYTLSAFSEETDTTNCPLCDFKQPKNRKICFKCGAQLLPNEKVTHKWRCDNCENMISKYPCEYCGK